MNYLWKTLSSSKDASTRARDKSNVSAPSIENATVENGSSIYDGNKVEFPRVIEKRFGESLGNRVALLNELYLADQLNIGIPDLIHFTCLDKFHKDEVGEFFNITGLDVSNEVMPVAFLDMLYSSIDSKILTYCCLNFFSGVDVRIRYESKNKYQITAIDIFSTSLTVQLNELLWEETFVSSIIRSIVINNNLQWKSPGLVELPLLLYGKSNSKRVVESLCNFLPRYHQCGWDTTKSMNCTVLNNYLTYSLLTYLTVCPGLLEHTIAYLQILMLKDTTNKLLYQVVIISLLEQDGEKELELISKLNETISPLLLQLDKLKPNDNNNFQVINTMTDLLNIQSRFLFQQNDFELALSVAKLSTELSSDSFESWYLLSKCYINLNDFEKALLAINSIPNLSSADLFKNTITTRNNWMEMHYKKPLDSTRARCDLSSHELDTLQSSIKNVNITIKEEKLKEIIFGRVAMPNNSNIGRMSKVWNQACLELGPIYGLQCANLINFVRPEEVTSVTNINLLRRNSMGNQLSWFQSKVIGLIMDITCRISWNDLLKLRSKIFVMEREYVMETKHILIQNKGIIPKEMRLKRLCERWLDQLFLDVYEDLRISTSIDENRDIKYSGLEWELLGLTMLRTWNWEDAITCLRTSCIARFDFIGCSKLLELYLCQEKDFQTNNLIDSNIILNLVAQKISYECRFYNNFQIQNFQVLFKLCSQFGVDTVKTKVTLLPNSENGIVFKMNEMLDWVSEMSNTKKQ